MRKGSYRLLSKCGDGPMNIHASCFLLSLTNSYESSNSYHSYESSHFNLSSKIFIHSFHSRTED